MTQPFPYVALVDGASGLTITFAAGTGVPGDYTFNRSFWSPAVTSRRVTPIGGRGAYQEVIEELDVNVTGATVAALYQNLARLNDILDTAERWAASEYIDSSTTLQAPVTFRVSFQGSTLSSTAAPWRAVVLGRAPGDTTRAPIELPTNFTDVGMTRYALRVRLRFWRRGRMLLPPSATWSSASTANGAVMSVTGVTLNTRMAPIYDLALAGFNSANNSTVSGGIIAVGGLIDNDSIRLQLMSTATAAGYTTFNDAANLPRQGTNVLRYTPTGTAAAASGWVLPGIPAPQTDSPFAVIAVVRNNHASRTFTIAAEFEADGVSVVTPTTPVDPAGNVPQIVRLGIVRHPRRRTIAVNAGWNQMRVVCSVDSITGSPTLDIDAIYVVYLYNETSRVIQHGPVTISSFTVGTLSLTVQTREDSELTPQLVMTNGTVAIPVAYYDPIDLETLDTICQVCWISSRANFWRFTTNAGAVVNLTASMSRNDAAPLAI